MIGRVLELRPVGVDGRDCVVLSHGLENRREATNEKKAEKLCA
jgi:hypothetical protein